MSGNFNGIKRRNFGIEIEMTGLTRCQAAKAAAQITAVKSDSDGTYTFTDKNNVLSDFDAAVTDGSVISKSGNALKIKADSGKTAVVTLT